MFAWLTIVTVRSDLITWFSMYPSTTHGFNTIVLFLQSSRTPSVEDDEDGHLIYRNGDILLQRCKNFGLSLWSNNYVFGLGLFTLYVQTSYFTDKIMDTLGEGTFGKFTVSILILKLKILFGLLLWHFLKSFSGKVVKVRDLNK